MMQTNDPPRAAKLLPRPNWLVITLRVLAAITLVVSAGIISAIWSMSASPTADSSMVLTAKIVETFKTLFAGVSAATVLYWLSTMLIYSYQTALNIRAAERRQMAHEVEAESQRGLAASDLAERMTLLLEDINENTLLNEQDKARKRARLADSRRERMQKEI